MAKGGVCLNYPDRFIDLETGETCHASCERYAEVKKELDKFNERQRAEKRKTMEVVGYEWDKLLEAETLKELAEDYKRLKSLEEEVYEKTVNGWKVALKRGEDEQPFKV